MIDPIEKKPLNHFPGSDILSFGTAGVTLVVGFAKTGVSARLSSMKPHSLSVSPEAVVQTAFSAGDSHVGCRRARVIPLWHRHNPLP
jgi:pyruvate formate lyase activating enzyme